MTPCTPRRAAAGSATASFDHVVAVASLCFVANEASAVREMARVARRRVALGLLGHRSLLWLAKRGTGAYVGARWHVEVEARTLLVDAGLREVRSRHAIFLAEGGRFARTIESILPTTFSFGGFLAVAGTTKRAILEMS